MEEENPQGQLSSDTDFLLYTHDQFLTLRRATIATSIIALTAAVIVLLSFLYLWIKDRKRANRISLRCVVIACAANAVDSTMNLSMSFVNGPQSFCRAGGIISNITRLISACFLAIVGINLVLIFVINVKRRDLLEYFYYPSAIIYVLICTVVSVYKAVIAENISHAHDTCWYLNYVIERSYAIFSWMWYYGFLFFINILAGISSAIALYKLLHEQRALRKNIDHRAYIGEASTNQAENRYQRRQSAVLSKVVVRCIIYPLIPLSVNIWGFVIQMMMTISNTQPSFVMAMLDTVFACLEGFFVFMVFFTDPALTAFIDDRIQYWRKVYVEEYRLVEIRNDESTDQEKKDEKSHTLYIMPPLDPPRETEWNAAIIHASATSRYSGTNHNSVPMRRIAIPPSSLEQLSSHYNIRQLSFCTLPTTSDTIETTQADNPPQFIPPPPPSQPPVSSDSLPPSLQQHQQQPQQIDASSTTHLTNNCYNNQFPSQESIIHVVFIPYKSALWARICNHFLSRYGLALFTPVSSRSVPRSSSTIELRSYAHPVNGNNDTINDLPANNYEASNDNEQEQKHRYKFSMADQTRHY